MLFNRSQDTDICILVDTEWITGQITGYRRQLSCSYMDRIVDRSDWFHYCIIVCTIESIPVDYNHYFDC